MTTRPSQRSLRPMTTDDVGQVAATLNAAQQLCGRGDVISVDELAAMMDMPSFDVGRDARVLVDPSGTIVGTVGCQTAEPWAASHVMPGVGEHPDRREILAQLVDVGCQLAAARVELGPDTVVEVVTPEEDYAFRAVLEERGFVVARRSAEMLRSVTDLSDAPFRPPAGVVVGALDVDDDETLHELAALHREAFSDHDGDYAMGTEDFVAFVRGLPSVRPDLSAVATEAGAPVGVAVSLVDVADPSGGTGYVASLGVARGARGRGVATALLAHTFRRFRDQGWHTARLHVQLGNRTGADRLYRAVGMAPRFVDLHFERLLRP